MKKFLVACLILFAANIGCKKLNPGDKLCGCSPVRVPELQLVIKNSAGQDLLSDKVAQFYSKDQISLIAKDKDGKSIVVNFAIRPPFTYGSEKFEYNTIYASISFLGESPGPLYLKLGADKIYQLSITLNKEKYNVDQLSIDNQAAEKATGTINNFATIFYLTEAN